MRRSTGLAFGYSRRPQTAIVLGMDSTVSERHGAQEGIAYHGTSVAPATIRCSYSASSMISNVPILHGEDMTHLSVKNIVLLVCVAIFATALSTEVSAQTCKRNPLGGYDCSNGVSSRPNPSGGLDYSNGTSSRPNPAGGYDYSNGASTRPNPVGGYDSSNGSTSRRNPSGGLTNSNGVTCNPTPTGVQCR